MTVPTAARSVLDILVIGAGQAGLAIGHALQAMGLRYELVDRNGRIGDSWRQRYDSLTLFTPRSYSHLPGLPFDGAPEGYATRDEMAAYLERYAERFGLPVRLRTAVVALEPDASGFVAHLDDGSVIAARAVVIATGAFQVPAVPSIAAGLSPDVKQLTPNSYFNPSTVPPGRVLVVGDGATGRQIAVELAASHDVLLAGGRKRFLAPQRLLGRSLFWWLHHTGLLRAPCDSRIGRRLKERDTIPRRDLRDDRLRAAGIVLVPRLTGLSGRTATFEDGLEAEIAAVVWSTGYRDDATWLHIDGTVDTRGAFIHSHGISPVRGLYFVGRPWQTSMGSALVTGVGGDAESIAARIASTLAH
jgi:putative flavoprotein involved in K+ transport